MTNILIPTDFTAASLKEAEPLLKNIAGGKVSLILFHAFEQPDSPFDLLGDTRRDPVAALLNEPFRQACKSLKDAYPKLIHKITVRCMRGSTKPLFRNFIDANDIDFIYCPDGYTHAQIHPASVNPSALFAKCGVPFYRFAAAQPAALWNITQRTLELAAQ